MVAAGVGRVAGGQYRVGSGVRMNRLIHRPDLRCQKSKCDQSFIIEYRVSEFVSTFVCKRHGDVVPLAKLSYPASAEPARASRE